MYIIEAKNVSVIRDQLDILKDVSLKVKEHDFITIIGPNGAGKSMLLKCMIGFFKPDKGVVVRKSNLKIGYVPQRMVPDHTLPITTSRFLTLRKKVGNSEISRISDETGISNLLDKLIHVLSGGELQRVLLARALLGSPELLVLDEPAQNLDVSSQMSFYKLLERVYQERNLSILMVSHDLHMVMASTKQVVCLFHHICCSGEPHVVTQDPAFISLFGNDTAKMMAVYHHEHKHDHIHD